MITIPGYSRPPSYFARNISLTPAGNISSTTLQAGIEELDSEKTTESYVNTATAAVPTGSKNLLYNGAMQVAQRGTSATGVGGGTYLTADRWRAGGANLGVWTESVENDAPTGSGFRKSLKYLCTTSDAAPDADDNFLLLQRLEGQDLQRIAKGTSSAKQTTLSFWVKSNVTGTFIAMFLDQDNSRSVSAAYTINAAATWEKKQITFPADTTGAFDNDNESSCFIGFFLGAGSNFTSGSLQTSWDASTTANRAVGQTNLAAATNNYWQITGVQLEVGDTATEFEHLPFGVELARCQRYFQRYIDPPLRGFAGNDTRASRMGMVLPVVMRSAPNATFSGTLSFADGGMVANYVSVHETFVSTTCVEFSFSLSAGFGTTGRSVVLFQGGGGSMALSAEL